MSDVTETPTEVRKLSPAEKMSANKEPKKRLLKKKQLHSNTLKKRRNSLGLTLAEVSKGVGITVGYLHALELGNNLPSLFIASKLARFYGCDMGDVWPEVK